MDNINNFGTALDEYKSAKDKLDKQLRDGGANIIGSAFQAVLKECPGIGVNWNQYVPGFNDGDPCTFTVGEFNVCLLEDISDNRPDECGLCEGDDGNIVKSDYPNKDILIDPSLITCEQYNQLLSIWNKLDNYILEIVFDSNAEITITRDDVTVDDYDCGH